MERTAGQLALFPNGPAKMEVIAELTPTPFYRLLSPSYTQCQIAVTTGLVNAPSGSTTWPRAGKLVYQ